MVHTARRLAGSAVVLSAMLLLAVGAVAAPPYYVDEVDSTPDYTQWDPAYGGIPDGGAACGPTAVQQAEAPATTAGATKNAPQLTGPIHTRNSP